MSAKWSDEKTLNLIHAVKRNKVIYENSNSQFDKNQIKKNWDTISDECNESATACKKQWSKIVDNYLHSSPNVNNRRLTRTTKFNDELKFLKTPGQDSSVLIDDDLIQKSKDKCKSRIRQKKTFTEKQKDASDCEESINNPPPINPIIIRKKNDKKEHEIRRKSTEKPLQKTQNIGLNISEKKLGNKDQDITEEVKEKNSLVNLRRSQKRKKELEESDHNATTKRLKCSNETSWKTPHTSKCNEEEITSRVDDLSNNKQLAKSVNENKSPITIINKHVKTEKPSNRKLIVSKQQHKGIQCELITDSNDFNIMKSIKPHYDRMNNRQKFLFKSKIYQSLLDVLGDSTDFPNNSPSTSCQNSHLSDFNLKSMELRLINELAGVVLATKRAELNSSNSRSINSIGTTTSILSPIDNRSLLKGTKIVTPILPPPLTSIASEFPSVNVSTIPSHTTEVVSSLAARLSTSVSNSGPKFIFKNVSVVSGAKPYYNTTTTNTVLNKPSITSTVNSKKTSPASPYIGEDKVNGVRSGELLKYTDEGGKTKVLYRFVTPKSDGENTNVSISAEKCKFVVPKIPKMMIQKSKVLTTDPASKLSLNRRNSIANEVSTSNQIIKNKTVTYGAKDGNTVNLNESGLLRQGKGENNSNISNPSKIIENVNNSNVRFLNNNNVGNINNISSVYNRNISSNGTAIVRLDENTIVIGSSTTKNNSSGMTLATMNDGQKQHILQNTESVQCKNLNETSGNLVNLNPTFSRPKLFRRQSVCGDGRVITTSANITPYNFQQNPVISSIDSLRAFRIRESQLQRPETITTATSGTRISTGFNLNNFAVTTNLSTNVNQFLPKTSTSTNNTNLKQTNTTTQSNKILTTIPLTNLVFPRGNNDAAYTKTKKSSEKVSVKPSLKSINNSGRLIIIKKEPQDEKK